MRQVELYVNDVQIDYNELKSIPASLRKRTDKFLEIVGADGTEVDNALRSLAVPGTPTNQSVLLSLMQQSQLGRGSTRVTVKMVVNGIMIFSGPGIVKKASKQPAAAPAFTIELLGDGLSLWEKLEGKSLNELDLGGLTWTFAETLDNWDDTDFTDYKAWWCPVVYGNLRGTGIFDIKEFRPAVGYYAIVQAIFNAQGYTVVSDFFETYYFRRWAHLFGVGDKWSITGNDWENAYFKGSFGAHSSWTDIATTTILTPFEADADPSGMYHNNGQPPIGIPPLVNHAYDNWVEIPFDGYYKIKVTLNAEDIVTEFIVAQYRTPNLDIGDTPYFFTDFYVDKSPAGAPGQTVEITLLCKAGDYIRTYSSGNLIATPSIDLRSVKIEVRMQKTPFLGSEIDLASCLPDKDQKEFLRGISHQFCLAWAVDDVTKRVFCEPRFDYEINEDGEAVRYRGFYRRDWPLQTLQIDAEQVETEYVSPFGESLRLTYKDSSNDPMEKALLAELQRDEDKKQPPYYADVELHDRGAKGVTSANPYFTTLYQSKPSDIELRQDAWLPTVLPSAYKRGDKLPGITWTPPGGGTKTEDAPTFESDPKCGMMFPKALSFEFYYQEGSNVTYFGEGVLAPWITQQKWGDQGGAPALSDWDSHGAYADLLAKDTGRNIKGLVSTFYPTYISTIKEGQVLTGTINIPLPTLAALNFRFMRRLPFDSNEAVWILLELSGYKALIDDSCSGEFIKYVTARQEDMDAVTYDDPDIDPITPDIAPENE